MEMIKEMKWRRKGGDQERHVGSLRMKDAEMEGIADLNTQRYAMIGMS